MADSHTHAETSEGLHYITALAYYSRARFILNLLPLLQQATALRRVITVFAAGKEGPIDTTDIQGWKVPLLAQRGHATSLVTLSLEALAKKAPEVTFIHNFPGAVKSNIARDTKGAAMFVLKAVFAVLSPFVSMAIEECGERHLFLATSAKYPAGGTAGDKIACVPVPDGVAVARGTGGESGSGVYSVDQNGESAGPKVEQLLAKFRAEGLVEKLWEEMEGEFGRIVRQGDK